METLSIRIKIGDREYPMRVAAEDEERLRRAGKLVNERMRDYAQRFGIDDKQDLLAMVAFDSVVDRLKVEQQPNDGTENIEKLLFELEQLIDPALED